MAAGGAPDQGRGARGPRRVRAVIFDKDGTLFDFHATWAAWSAELLGGLADGDMDLRRRLGQSIGFDPDRGTFAPGSPVVAETVDRIAARLAPLLPGWDAAALEDLMVREAARAPQVEAVPLAPLLDALLAGGLRLGVVTNDGEAAARAQLGRAGVGARFAFVAGYDSGHGGKPEPGALLAFATAQGLHPAEVIMVGDSLHDLDAARAAGMRAVAVLTGPAGHAELAPSADAVLSDISELPAWIAAQGAEPLA